MDVIYPGNTPITIKIQVPVATGGQERFDALGKASSDDVSRRLLCLREGVPRDHAVIAGKH